MQQLEPRDLILSGPYTVLIRTEYNKYIWTYNTYSAVLPLTPFGFMYEDGVDEYGPKDVLLHTFCFSLACLVLTMRVWRLASFFALE